MTAKKSTKKKSTKPPSKKASPPKPSNQKVYTVRDIGLNNAKTIGSLIAEGERNADRIDALKKPYEKWALQIGGKGNYIVSTSFRRIMGGIHDSGSLRQLADNGTRKQQQNLINSIKIMKVNQGPVGSKIRLDKQRKINNAKFEEKVVARKTPQMKRKIEKQATQIKAAKKDTELLKKIAREGQKREMKAKQENAKLALQIARLKAQLKKANVAKKGKKR